MNYFINRLFYNFLVLLGVITLVFLLFNVLPGDPARLTMGQRTDLATIENARKEMNLDKPLLTRYGFFLNDLSPISLYPKSVISERNYKYVLLSTKDNQLVVKAPYLGRSYRTKKEVTSVLLDALPGTIILALTAMFIATIIGIALGIIAALKKDTWLDTSAIALSVSGISLPSFFAGLLIAYLFGFLLHRYTGLNMTGSLWEYSAYGSKRLAIENLILPAIALGIRPMAIITQLTRSSLLDVLEQDYVRTAKAKGLSNSRIVLRHALPNALNPVVTAISGWMAELLAGSFFVEYIFGWKGVGKITVDALGKFDFPLVMGSVLLTTLIFIIINFLTDFTYTLIDPRVSRR